MAMFQLYCVRHGLAGQFGDYDDDSVRPLTEEGQQKTRKVAKRLRELGIHCDRLLTSPYQRAHQTAAILQEAGVADRLETVDFLAPDSSIEPLLSWLDRHRQENQVFAIVGHEPELSEWAELLVFGQAIGRLTLKKAGVIGLELPIAGDLLGRGHLFWLAPPRLIL